MDKEEEEEENEDDDSEEFCLFDTNSDSFMVFALALSLPSFCRLVYVCLAECPYNHPPLQPVITRVGVCRAEEFRKCGCETNWKLVLLILILLTIAPRAHGGVGHTYGNQQKHLALSSASSKSTMTTTRTTTSTTPTIIINSGIICDIEVMWEGEWGR